MHAVALRKESVDRNGCLLDWDAIGYTSLSARRAWIEIPGPKVMTPERYVALRKESVDRNDTLSGTFRSLNSRSPQGERG